jgi:glycerol-3-phosphate O-acyltransferase
MQDYDSIRPYTDQEVPGVVERVVNNPEFGKAASKVVMPPMLQNTSLGDWVTRLLLRLRTRGLNSIEECQLIIADYFERLVDDTITELTVSGLDTLDPAGCYLFMSNHRDIVMDSGLLNFVIHNAGHETCRMAVGDNLLANDLAADLMRLNKSFVVERSVVGARASLNAYTRTSSYIRDSLAEGVSIWIAQRPGRAKDGWDRTDQALLKMLTLAFKEFDEPVVGFLQAVTLVPVSISYEIDPCANRKAHELALLAEHGSYDKSSEEDLDSIIAGMVGQKGRVHLHFGEPLAAGGAQASALTTVEDLADYLDRAIVDGMHIFPTHIAAALALGDSPENIAQDATLEEVMALFEQAKAACPERERPFFLLQYANLLRNRDALAKTAIPAVE